MMPRDVIANQLRMFVHREYDFKLADDVIDALGEAGYEIVQRKPEYKPWWNFGFSVSRDGEKVVMV